MSTAQGVNYGPIDGLDMTKYNVVCRIALGGYTVVLYGFIDLFAESSSFSHSSQTSQVIIVKFTRHHAAEPIGLTLSRDDKSDAASKVGVVFKL